MSAVGGGVDVRFSCRPAGGAWPAQAESRVQCVGCRREIRIPNTYVSRRYGHIVGRVCMYVVVVHGRSRNLGQRTPDRMAVNVTATCSTSPVSLPLPLTVPARATTLFAERVVRLLRRLDSLLPTLPSARRRRVTRVTCSTRPPLLSGSSAERARLPCDSRVAPPPIPRERAIFAGTTGHR